MDPLSLSALLLSLLTIAFVGYRELSIPTADPCTVIYSKWYN